MRTHPGRTMWQDAFNVQSIPTLNLQICSLLLTQNTFAHKMFKREKTNNLRLIGQIGIESESFVGLETNY